MMVEPGPHVFACEFSVFSFFSLDQSGNQTGGDWRKVYSGNSTFKDNFAAGTSFVVIRRSDATGRSPVTMR
jgi:hypothetical protein